MKPPPKQSAATAMVLRGPTRSTQRPKTAAEAPRKKIAMLKIQASCGCVQSLGAGAVMPMAFVSGKFENAEGVDLPDREVNREGGGRNQPAAKSRAGDGAFAIEESHRPFNRIRIRPNEEAKFRRKLFCLRADRSRALNRPSQLTPMKLATLSVSAFFCFSRTTVARAGRGQALRSGSSATAGKRSAVNCSSATPRWKVKCINCKAPKVRSRRLSVREDSSVTPGNDNKAVFAAPTPPPVDVHPGGSEYKLTLGGYIQANFEDGDVSAFEGRFGATALKDRFRLRRARITLTGDFAEQFDFKIEGDFEQSDAAITALKSVDPTTGATTTTTNSQPRRIFRRPTFSSTGTAFPKLNMRVGQWKAPFGLEKSHARHADLHDRAQPADGRDHARAADRRDALGQTARDRRA